MLLKHGADARCEDDDNTTPLDLASDTRSKKLLSDELRRRDRELDRALNGTFMWLLFGRCCTFI